MTQRTSVCCPNCGSIDFWKIDSQARMDRWLSWLMRPFHCGLCGVRFYLFNWRIPAEA